MSKNFSNWRKLLGLPLWVVAGAFISQVILAIILSLINLKKLLPEATFITVVAAASYILMLFVVVGMPVWLKKSKYRFTDFKLKGLMTWTDIGLTLAGMVMYIILAAVFFSIVQAVFPGFNMEQVQDIGFNKRLNEPYQYYLALITLVIMAPVAEEMLFRGYFFSKLRNISSFWVTAIIVSLVFGLVHGAWNVAIDVFALSLVLCYLREITDSIWAPILLHMTKNGIAYFVLFIYPLL